MTVANHPSGAPIAVCNVSKHYGSFTAVDDITLDVGPGSFCTFLGPSGSGKTTTLNIVSGLVDADQGIVEIAGRDVTRLSAERRDLGFVFQSYALFPHMTVEKNIEYPLKLRKIAAAERRRRVGEALDLVRLSNIAGRYPSELSGGQQQRVALARAFVFSPKVLLMDEPLSALDAGLRSHLQREIVRITRELGCTVLYVTHDQEEALSMSDQVILFNNGRIEQAGTPAELYRTPRSAFSATFVGAGRLLGGRLERQGSDWAIVGDRAWVIPVNIAADRPIAGSVAAVFRAETATLRKPDATLANGCIHLADGRVSEAIFLGGQMRVMIDLGDGHELECRCNSTEAWRPGDPVSLDLRKSDLPVAVSYGS
ncbi:ABC transporter ATP-binding protein [Rhizobium sp. SYY.PMSO]|uniref:ABC transporter ATP-binding protein n=1 Tax=Rhizobium sp. SYY.PMSO TaxID=3382192 RepID=UPI00398FDB28